MNTLRLGLRTLRREWRLPELRTLAAALLLAVAALGAVATLAARVEAALLASAAELIGGDAGISDNRPLPPAVAAEAQRLALTVNRSSTFPSVAFNGTLSQLLDVRATDASYPLRGTLRLADAAGRIIDGRGPAAGTVDLDHRALVALDLTVGDRVQIGGRELTIGAEIVREPDGGELFAIAPRALMSLADAEAAGLLGTGSRVQHRLLVAGSAASVDEFVVWLKAHRPPDAELITPERTQQRLRIAFDRAGAFLRLSALLSALLAGVAIALSAQRYARRKTDEIALLRALGAPRGQVRALVLVTLLGMALPALLLGALLALGLSSAAWTLARGLLPGTAGGLPLLPALAAAIAGLALLLGFALPPLARLAEVAPVAVFRRGARQRVRALDALYLLPVLVAVGLAWFESGSFRLAGILAASLAGVAVIAALLATLLLALIRRLAPGAHPALRLGLAALARRRALSLIQATALALGLTALLLLAVIAPALLDRWRAELPADTPNWFALNIQDDQRMPVTTALDRLGARKLNRLPLAVGKLASINGVPVASVHFRDRATRDWAEQQLRLSWSAVLPPANTLVAGRWFTADPAQPQASVEQGWAQRFGVKLGDTLGFRIGEDTYTARVTSLRKVDWTSFRVNFFLLLDPAHARALPHSWLASWYLPPGNAPALAAFNRSYGNLSLIDVNALLDRVRDIIVRVTAAVRWVLGFSLLAGALVLAAALASSAAERRREAALLRTLGASSAQLRAAAAAEFALLGLIAGLTAALGAAATGAWIAASVMDLPDFVPPLPTLGLAALAAALGVMLLGLAGTRRVLATSPLALLRRG
ncbi:MAG: FtsX-like permease family protein [Xanthomonadaceae bacterium]|nr:FtsX-like permease family protein [Xanthomonadaceae bacterium]MDE2177210.1 FtsX-like permease family protein [Xanthomonadaceae bacterium]MDE2244594.1 FtsX-like permease family protein [Xanthomonadaceae bacterium]